MVVLLVLSWMGAAFANPSVQVIETFPAGDEVALGRNQNFYLRLAYQVDSPSGIWITPYFRGKSVPAGTNPSPRHTGDGEALAWFFLLNATDQVDEIRIRVGNGSINMPVIATYRVRISGNSQPARQTAPAWVADRLRHARETANAAPVPAASNGSYTIVAVFMLSVLVLGIGGLVGPIWAMRRWDGGWRIAAGVPGAMVAFVMLRIVVGGIIEPTSHNLWPFEVLIIGSVSTCLLALLAVLRWAAGARPAY